MAYMEEEALGSARCPGGCATGSLVRAERVLPNREPVGARFRCVVCGRAWE